MRLTQDCMSGGIHHISFLIYSTLSRHLIHGNKSAESRLTHYQIKLSTGKQMAHHLQTGFRVFQLPPFSYPIYLTPHHCGFGTPGMGCAMNFGSPPHCAPAATHKTKTKPSITHNFSPRASSWAVDNGSVRTRTERTGSLVAAELQPVSTRAGAGGAVDAHCGGLRPSILGVGSKLNEDEQ